MKNGTHQIFKAAPIVDFPTSFAAFHRGSSKIAKRALKNERKAFLFRFFVLCIVFFLFLFFAIFFLFFQTYLVLNFLISLSVRPHYSRLNLIFQQQESLMYQRLQLKQQHKLEKLLLQLQLIFLLNLELLFVVFLLVEWRMLFLSLKKNN